MQHAAWTIVGMGAYAAGIFTRAFYLGRASTAWPRAEATVLSSEVAVVGLGNRGGSGYNLEGAAYIRYTYDVRGEQYRGDRLRFGPSWWWLARREANQFREGDLVSVAYDPKKPELSVLRPGLTWSIAFCLPASFGLLALGIAWLVG
jgi:hypothetical protein